MTSPPEGDPVDLFERELRDELLHVATHAPPTFALERVYGRAQRLHREQYARVTVASLGVAAMLVWAVTATAGRPLGSHRLDPATTPTGPPPTATATVSPGEPPSATPSGESAAPDPGNGSGTEPVTEPSGSPAPEPIPIEGSQDPFDPEPDALNGPEQPRFTTSERDVGGTPRGTTFTVEASDPDGWVESVFISFDDATDAEPSGWRGTYEYDCDPEHPVPTGQPETVATTLRFLTPGDHVIHVEVTSADCTAAFTGGQTVARDVTVHVEPSDPTPLPRKDVS